MYVGPPKRRSSDKLIVVPPRFDVARKTTRNAWLLPIVFVKFVAIVIVSPVSGVAIPTLQPSSITVNVGVPTVTPGVT